MHTYTQYINTYTHTYTRILLQEIQLYNQLLTQIKGTLDTLVACMQGLQTFDVSTDEFAHSVYTGQVPHAWLRSSYPTELPLMPYLRHLSEGVAYFAKWMRAGTPTAFWLPAFFFPRAVASATAVNFSRHMQVWSNVESSRSVCDSMSVVFACMLCMKIFIGQTLKVFGLCVIVCL